jgi:regulation of enolase protein 1 (concanavalin A-like superfamily)
VGILSQVGTPGYNATCFSDTSLLTPGTTYFYRVRATNTVGDSANSNVASATTDVPTAPAAPSNLVATSVNSTTISLSWTDNASNETGFIIERSPDGLSGWTQIATPAADATSYSNSLGLDPNTTYYYRVRATNAVGDSGNSNVASAKTAPATVLPAPWASSDVGSTGAVGGASVSGGTYTILGAGSAVGGTADSFRYVYQQLKGNHAITVRVTGVENTDAGAMAGIMLRSTLDANSKDAALVITPSQGIQFIRRSTTGGSSTTTSSTGKVAPYWLRLSRSSNTITASISTNGTTWTTLGSASISLGSNYYVGMLVCSKVTDTLNTSTFDNVSVV